MQTLEDVVGDATGNKGSAYITASGATSWIAWADLVKRYRDALPPDGARVGLVMRRRPEPFAALAAAILQRLHVYLIDELTDEAALAVLVEDHALQAVFDARPDGLCTRIAGNRCGGPDGRWITLFTSGSTGKPKAVRHSWETLTRPVRLSTEGGAERWLLAYRPHLYAGLQVILHCLLNRATLVLPTLNTSAQGILTLMRDAAVTHVSATPSYWRWLVSLGGKGALETVALKQITLGGETADQAVLDALTRLFPRARLVHIYATSEAGRCFSVADGREGFPAKFLEAHALDGVRLKIEGGELIVRSSSSRFSMELADAAPIGDAGWIRTGDLVERVGDRVRFVGRRSDIINVGGHKVHPLVVEKVVRSIPGVADARVYAKPSSLAGQLVACDIVIEPEHDPAAVVKSVQRRCLEALTSHERPRMVEIVSAIALSTADKTSRQT